MYERFTDRSRKVIQLALQEAQRLGHEYIDTAHILLGLVKEGSGMAANVLKNLGIDLRKIRDAVEAISPAGTCGGVPGKLPQTPNAKKVIEMAVKAASDLHHNYVGTEHLLLGLCGVEGSKAAQVLASNGVTTEAVREDVLRILGHDKDGKPVSDDAEVVRRLRSMVGDEAAQMFFRLAQCWPVVDAILSGKQVASWATEVQMAVVEQPAPPPPEAVDPFFKRGQEDGGAGVPASANPFTTDEHRLRWLDGWKSAREVRQQ